MMLKKFCKRKKQKVMMLKWWAGSFLPVDVFPSPRFIMVVNRFLFDQSDFHLHDLMTNWVMELTFYELIIYRSLLYMVESNGPRTCNMSNIVDCSFSSSMVDHHYPEGGSPKHLLCCAPMNNSSWSLLRAPPINGVVGRWKI